MHFLDQFFREHPVIAGAFLAFVTSMLRLANRSGSITNKLIDSALCMSLTTGIFYGLNYFSPLDPKVALCIGSFVGYLGTEQIKEIILRAVDIKTNSNISGTLAETENDKHPGEDDHA
jgi:lambda family phage holin